MSDAPVIGSDEAQELDRRAEAIRQAHPQQALSGSFNTNIRVDDFNVRRPLDTVAKSPYAWRLHTEAAVLRALGGMRGRVPELLYADPDRRFLIQNWVEAQTLREVVKAGLVASVDEVPRAYFEQVARFWRDLQDVDLPHVESLPDPMVRRLAAGSSHAPGIRRAPTTLAEYTALHVQTIAMYFDESTKHSEFIARRLGFPADPERYARQALDRLTDAPLAPAHPDLHIDNLGVRDGGQWEPFFFDVELVSRQDPRHALATMLYWGGYGDAKQAEILDAHTRAAPAHLRPTLKEDVHAWYRYAVTHRATQKLAGWAQATEKHVSALADLKVHLPYFTRLTNEAARVWGAPAVTERYVWETLLDATRMNAQQKRFPDAVTAGFGVLASRGPVFPVLDADSRSGFGVLAARTPVASARTDHPRVAATEQGLAKAPEKSR
ncbi:hypothetical protein [Yinghuangia aomiensis]